MKTLGHRGHPRPHIIILAEPPMDEDELSACFAGADKTPLWRAMLQLIDTAERNARISANEYIESAPKLIGYTAAAEHLLLLRDEMFRRREIALKALRRRRPGDHKE